MNNISLKEICRVSDGCEENKFVGIKIISGIPSVSFPLGYKIGNSDDQLRKDIRILIRILKRFSQHVPSEQIRKEVPSESGFPIDAYQRMILDFINNGNYSEKEVTYRNDLSGKINWNKTIKNCRPVLQEKNAVYLNFMVKNTNVKNTLIAEIYKYCVYISFLHIGWMFTSYSYRKPQMKFNKKMFLSVVYEKLSETYADRHKDLFLDMISIISSYNEHSAKENHSFGTYEFEYVWEKLIDSAFGINNKSDYFPVTYWHFGKDIKTNHALLPDTIMIRKPNAYVLDAKYYRFGCTGAASHLPDTSSVHKQITYGEYLHTSGKFNPDNIYNAFLLPANLNDNDFKYFGYADSDWKSSGFMYEEVAGVLVDTKYLMCNFTKKDIVSNDLANVLIKK